LVKISAQHLTQTKGRKPTPFTTFQKGEAIVPSRKTQKKHRTDSAYQKKTRPITWAKHKNSNQTPLIRKRFYNNNIRAHQHRSEHGQRRSIASGKNKNLHQERVGLGFSRLQYSIPDTKNKNRQATPRRGCLKV